MQAYSNPKRESNPYALPDIEVFHLNEAEAKMMSLDLGYDGDYPMPAGWYWWSCFPGCLPDSDPIGPFATEAECIADFTSGN